MSERAEDPSAEAVVWPIGEPDVAERDESAEEATKTAPAGTRYSLIRMDAVEWLRTLPDASVDLVVTDPPYESLEKHRAVGTTTRLSHSKGSSNDWFTVFPNARFPELFAEVHRVLKKNAHFYLYCDQETAFVAKPVGEAAGFKFWKPLVWDKCLDPATLVRTARGVVPLGTVQPGDRVWAPSGQHVAVLATRTTRAETLRLSLSDGTHVVCSPEHRFVAANGDEVEARQLVPGTAMAVGGDVAREVSSELALDGLLSDEERVLELPDTSQCLFCERTFESPGACSAHQARHCERARSKEAMAEELGIPARRLRRWMANGALPMTWARALGLEHLATGRFRQALADDARRTVPRSITLDYAWGRFIGLFAAEGTLEPSGISFAFHERETLLHTHVARMARSIGLRARVTEREGTRAVIVAVSYLVARRLVETFVGGRDAITKHFTPAVDAAPRAFRDGVLDGLLEGDGSWSHDEQRTTLNVASADLAYFALRGLRERGLHATLRPFSNEHAGGFRVRCDPQNRAEPLVVTSIEPGQEQQLVDIAIDDDAQLYELANGLVTHNCAIGMGYHYRSRYELILFFEKGKRKLSDLGVADLIREKRIHRGYPTEKPVAVSRVLIEQSSLPGELVIDPFMGTASAGVAAVLGGRTFYGADISEKAIAIAEERLAATGAERHSLPPGRNAIVPAGQLTLDMKTLATKDGD